MGRNGTIDHHHHRKKSDISGPINGTLRGNNNGHAAIYSAYGTTASVSNGGHHNNHSAYSSLHGSAANMASSSMMAPGFPGGAASEWSLAMSPPPTTEARHSIVRPKNLAERARLNVA